MAKREKSSSGSNASPSSKPDSDGIRLSSTVAARLRRMARDQGTTPSRLAEMALNRYIEFEFLANRFGMMDFEEVLGPKMKRVVRDEDVRELAKWAADSVVKPFMLFWFGREDVESVISSLCVLRSCARLFEVDHNRADYIWSIVIRHEMNEKWTIFYHELLETLMRDVPDIEELRIRHLNNQVTADVFIKPGTVEPDVKNKKSQIEPVAEQKNHAQMQKT